MKFVAGMVLGVVLSVGGVSLYAQSERVQKAERALHPRVAMAIDALRDARAYLSQARSDFGGRRDAAIRATDEAINQLNLILQFK